MNAVAVSVGDMLYIAIHPNGNYTYDSTRVDLTISVTNAPAATPTAFACTTWNIANDFQIVPNQENPNRDSCNNPGIWNFMESMSLTRSPQNYSLMPNFSSNSWYGTYSDSNGNFPVVASSTSYGTKVIDVHPAPGRMAIIAWRSPMNGYVSITGGVSDLDPGGGDGILWYIDQNSTNLASGGYANGGSQTFVNGAGGSNLNTVAVSVGDMLYIAIHPNGNYYYDSTRVDLNISATSAPTPTITPTFTSTPSKTPTATLTRTPTSTPSPTPSITPTASPTFELTPPTSSGPITINYTYDPLNRLTAANYSTGDYYHYTYDPVGNRLTQQTQSGTTNYGYDIVNRLTSVNSSPYTWDANGNLLNDGMNTYTYDPANRLTTVSGQQTAISFGYNGLGDRLQQTFNGQTTDYSLDINTDLPDVLTDNSNNYIYGLGNVSQIGPENTSYFLGDALGSTRQLTDSVGDINLSQAYDPFGSSLGSVGNASSIFGYTGQQTDVTGLQYLRARYYDPGTGRFLSRDPFAGYLDLPQSQNPYAYGLNNPVFYIDPSGKLVLPWNKTPDNPVSRIGAVFSNVGVNKAMDAVQNFLDGHCIQWDKLLMDAGAEAVAIVVGAVTSVGNSYMQGWANVKNAVKIYLNPHASVSDRILSGLYIGTWVGAHILLVVGIALMTYGAIVPACATNPACEDEASQTGTELARTLGQAGEEAADIIKNTQRIPSASDTAAYRIPDQLLPDQRLISEVKNVSKISLTNQLEDFISYAKAKNYTFDLWTRTSTEISEPLQKFIDSGKIIHRYLP